MYLSLGAGRHVDEARFSVLSAARFHGDGAGWAVRVYTDRPDLFADLPAEVEALSPDTVRSWAGRHDYVYRGKIAALADALARPGTARAAVIDGDTYFTRSPSRLFRWVAPGRSVVHRREGRPHPPEQAALRSVLAGHVPVDRTGVPWGVTETQTLWNSGVVGLHRADAALCDEALDLTDQLLDHGFGERSHTAEMVAVGVVLERRTVIRETSGTVTHYWPAAIRKPFLPQLQQAWSDPTLDPAAAFERLWPQRPRESHLDRGKLWVKRTAGRAGLELGRRT